MNPVKQTLAILIGSGAFALMAYYIYLAFLGAL